VVRFDIASASRLTTPVGQTRLVNNDMVAAERSDRRHWQPRNGATCFLPWGLYINHRGLRRKRYIYRKERDGGNLEVDAVPSAVERSTRINTDLHGFLMRIEYGGPGIVLGYEYDLYPCSESWRPRCSKSYRLPLNDERLGVLYGHSERSSVLYGNHIYIVGRKK